MPISFYIRNIISRDYPFLDIQKFIKFPHGINVTEFDDLEALDIREIFEINNDTKLICYVARLSKEKNCLDIPEIVKALLKYRDDFVLLVIGDGKEYSRLKQEADEAGISDYIKLVGFRDKKIVFNAKKMADKRGIKLSDLFNTNLGDNGEKVENYSN